MSNTRDYQIAILGALVFDTEKQYIQPEDLDGIEWAIDIAPAVKGCIEYRKEGFEYDLLLLKDKIGLPLTKEISARVTTSLSGLLFNAQVYLKELKKQQAESAIIRKADKGEPITREDVNKFLEIINDKKQDENVHTFKDGISKYLDLLEAKMKPDFERYNTGIDRIDDMLGGLVPGMLITTGGLSGLSKTNIALNIFNHLVLRKINCAYLSSEMAYSELYDRLFAMNSDDGETLSAFKLRNGDITKEELKRLNDIVTPLYENENGIIIETSRFNINKIKKYIEKYNSKFIFIDFLQMFALEAGHFIDSRASAMSEMSTRLKELAMETKTIIFALSQVNADGEMKESRGIEEKSDVVMKMKIVSDTASDFKTFDLEISKNRYGSTGTVPMKLNRKTTRITPN